MTSVALLTMGSVKDEKSAVAVLVGEGNYCKIFEQDVNVCILSSVGILAALAFGIFQQTPLMTLVPHSGLFVLALSVPFLAIWCSRRIVVNFAFLTSRPERIRERGLSPGSSAVNTRTKSGGLGDIMGSRPRRDSKDLSTGEDEQLSHMFADVTPPFSAIERIALTANGNLQRILCSLHDTRVAVEVVYCRLKGAGEEPSQQEHQWERKVEIRLKNRLLVTAESDITVRDEDCKQQVMSKRIGLGQLFRYLDRLPDFTLLGAGRSVHGGMWRRYELHCPEITCIITEYFERDALLTGAD
jgi:chorismate-pyruvate lyase